MNWPDLRESDKPSWSSQWCHGAVGIGLGTIAINNSGINGSKVNTLTINHALRNTQTEWPHKIDTLCCGTLVSIVFLAEA